MIFKSFFFNLSIWVFFLVLLYDVELVFLTIFLLIWHLMKGLTSILNDYIYSKPLQLVLLFFLQIATLETLTYTINFLF